MPARIAVLASGGGSNLGALLDHLDAAGARRAGQVVLVASNVAGAGALDRARARGIATAVADPADGDALAALLAPADLVLLAGYLKLVPPIVARAFRGRMLNVHPALLPAFGGPGMYGRRVHAAVLAAGARVTGATVHFVDEAYDRGAIAAQWPVPVHAADTPDTLARRVLRVEHLLLPRVVTAVASGRIALGPDGRAHGAPEPAAYAAAGDDASLAAAFDAAFAR